MKTHCKRGHARTPENVDKNKSCIECLKLTEKKRYKERYTSDTEFKNRHIKSSRKSALNRTGWTPELVEETKHLQNNCCDLCKQPFENEKPCADHAHNNPPTPRGLLHNRCNSMLGAVENLEFRILALAYLRKWGK
jgi:DNA repair exonuclease SbcCD ATPase subunit